MVHPRNVTSTGRASERANIFIDRIVIVGLVSFSGATRQTCLEVTHIPHSGEVRSAGLNNEHGAAATSITLSLRSVKPPNDDISLPFQPHEKFNGAKKTPDSRPYWLETNCLSCVSPHFLDDKKRPLRQL